MMYKMFQVYVETKVSENEWTGSLCVHFMHPLPTYFEVIGGERSSGAVLGGHVHGWVGPQFCWDCRNVSVRLLHCHSRAVETSDGPLTRRHSPGELEISLPYHSLLRAAQLATHVRPLTRHREVVGRRRRQGSVQVTEADLVGGLSLRQDPVGLQRDALLHPQVGCVGFAVDVPRPLHPGVLTHVVFVFIILSEALVLVGVSLILLSQPAQRLGPLPRRGAALPQRIGAGHRQAAHVVDHGGDVVSVADHAAAHDGLRKERRLSLFQWWQL